MWLNVFKPGNNLAKTFAGRASLQLTSHKFATVVASIRVLLIVMACVASGADQLKEERLRYNATAEPGTADESNGHCWDLSSEDDCSLTPIHHQSDLLEAPVASAAGLGAQLQVDSDGQQTLSYHNESPQHTALINAVKQMLQQDGMVMTSLHGKPTPESLPDSLDLASSPQSQNYAQQGQTLDSAAAPSQEDQACVEADTSDVAVHKFPVEKQLLLQMRFRQMHGRKPADLITTPAKHLPNRSFSAGIVSPSHVGPAQPSSEHLHHHSSQSEMQLPTATIYGNTPTKDVVPYRRHGSPDAARKAPPDIPLFEDLPHFQDAAALQEAEAGMTMVQHAMTDPGVHAQWPKVAEAPMPAQQRLPISQQRLHEQQMYPSYAWSTHQLTAIAASAATAAAVAFQQEMTAKQTALAVAADTAKSAEQVQIRTGALKKPEVRQGMQAAAAAVSAAAQDAQTVVEPAILGSLQDSNQIGSSSQAPVSPTAVKQDHHLLKQSQHVKKQQVVPKQHAALHKLKHRSSVSRGLNGPTVPHPPHGIETNDQSAFAKAPAESAEQTKTDRLVAQDHHATLPHMQQVVLPLHLQESIARAGAGLRWTLEPLPMPQIAANSKDLHQQAARVVEAELGGAFNFAEMRRKLIELQAANPGAADPDFDFRAVPGKQATAQREESVGLAVLDNFMAADATFSDARALQEATAKDVKQRIATAHLRPMPSNVAPSRPDGLRPVPGNKRKFAAPAMAPFAELPISNANVQSLQPSRQQSGHQKQPNAQEQAPPASTRQKKKPRVAFGRRVGVALSRKLQATDLAADPQEPKQAATDLNAGALHTLPISSTAAVSHTSASRLEAIVQASRAISVSPKHAPAAGTKPYGRQAQTTAARYAVLPAEPAQHIGQRIGQPAQDVGQHIMPSAQVQHAGPLGSTEVEGCLLHTSTAMPAAQGQEREAAQAHLERAATEKDAWQIPYNHAEYADEDFLHSPASNAAVHAAQHAARDAARAMTTLDGCPSAMVLPAAGQGLSAISERPDVASRSDIGLQAQYDTLLTDLAAQQQQQLHFPATRLSRLWDQQNSASIATEASLGVQSGSALANVSGSTPNGQYVQPEAVTADANTSPMPPTATSGAYPASQVVVLPEDPFHQQLPQHLHELIQLSQQLTKQLPKQLPEQLPEQLHTHRQPQHSSGPSQLHHVSPQASAASQPKLVQSASVSSATPPLPQQPSMPQQHLAEDQLRLEAEFPHTGTKSALPSPKASSALPSVVLPSSMEDPADKTGHQAPDSDCQGTAADSGKQRCHKQLLRASLAEWLADAVASKMWVAFEKQRQAGAPVGALGSPSPLTDVLLDRCALNSLAHQAVSEELADLLSNPSSSSGHSKQWQASVRASVSFIASKHSRKSSHGSGCSQSASVSAQPGTDDIQNAQIDTSSLGQESPEGTAAMAARAGNPSAQAVALQPDGTGLSPLDDALLQLVLQTLTEGSLEQIQEHQQRQHQQQQQVQQEAIERQLALQLLAQSSLQQLQSCSAKLEHQRCSELSASEASASLPSPTVTHDLSAEQAQQQIVISASQAHEALLEGLAKTALTNLHQEQQQEQQQQQLLQQQQEVYEQQQRLLEQQSAVHDALLQQQQWEQAQQQQQVYAEQQKLIQQQQIMLEALQHQQQQLTVAAYDADHAVCPQLDHNSATFISQPIGSTGGAPSSTSCAVPQGSEDSCLQEHQGHHAQPHSQPTSSDPTSPPPMPVQLPTQLPAAVEAPQAAAPSAQPAEDAQPAEYSQADDSRWPDSQAKPIGMAVAASTAPALAVPAATISEPHTSRAHIMSQHSNASSCHSQLPLPLQDVPATFPAFMLQPGAQPASLPQAYFLIPAPAYDASKLPMLPSCLPQPANQLPPMLPVRAPALGQHATEAQVAVEQQQRQVKDDTEYAGPAKGQADGLEYRDCEASLTFSPRRLQQPGADAPCTTGSSQAKSVSQAQPVPRQLPAAQARQASLTEQARLYRLSGTPQLQSSVQSQPQPLVTNAWMERLLQELSLDDEEDGDGPVGYGAVAQDLASAPAQLLHQPLSAASGPLLLPHTQSSHQEHTFSSGQQSPDSSAAAATASSSHHQHPAPGLPAGKAAHLRLADMTPAVLPGAVPSSGAVAQPEGAQQGVPQLPQCMDSPQPDSAAPALPGMHRLAATMQLLHQIDLETADHHAASDQLPAALPTCVSSQQLSLQHPAAADVAAGNDSKLLGRLAVTGQADTAVDQNGGSSGSLAQPAAVQPKEEGQSQEASAGNQHAESPQQEADGAERQSQQHHGVQGLNAAGTCSTQGCEAPDSSTDGSHEAASWGMQEEASPELEGQFSAGTDRHEDCQEERFPPYLWRQGQPPASQPQSPAANRPSASLSSSQGDEEEALPSSLSDMARHFQAQRAARAHRRDADYLPTKFSRTAQTGMPKNRAETSLQHPAADTLCSQHPTSSTSSSNDSDNDSFEDSAVHSSAVTVHCDRVTWQRQSSSTTSTHAYAYRYASRAKKYAIQRRNIVAQAGIQDSLLCSTATGTAATSSSAVNSMDTAADSSFSTMQTDSSLFASPALSVVPEACSGTKLPKNASTFNAHDNAHDFD